MKHIKKYEGFSINTDSERTYNFEPNDPVLDIIRDRLIDLSDDYQCSINKRRSFISVKIEKLPIYDNKPRVRFCISDILDDIIPLISHMDSEYNLSVGLLYGISYMNVTKIIDKTYIQQLEDIKYSKIYGIQLSFFKRWVPKVFENSFLEKSSSQYGIYDWFEDLKRFQWSQNQKSMVSESSLKKWSDQFIGEGYWEKIKDLVDKMFIAMSKVDTDYINDRMYDVYDEIPDGKENWTMCCVAYGDYENHDKPNNRKYNGLLSVPKPKEGDKLNIIISILKDIVNPTLTIGYPSYVIRQSDEQFYVTDKKWQCKNFNIDDYGIKDGFEYPSDNRRGKGNVYSSDIDKKKKYSIDKILDMYKPCVTINIGGYGDSHLTGKMNLKKLESDIDEVLPAILPTLDYEEVIFDSSRGDRHFDDDSDVYDYTIKILLNF
jgi:hypothetical protein